MQVLWSEDGMVGATRFLNRVYNFAEQAKTHAKPAGTIRLEDLTPTDQKAYRKLNQVIKKVEEDVGTLQLNTAIASMMELLNVMDDLDAKASAVLRLCVDRLAQLLGPFTPHLAEEIWETLGHKESLFRSKWPKYDKDAIIEEEITFVVQVNGKLRASMNLALDVPEKKAKELALSDERVKRLLKGKKVVKSIFVPNKLINLVIK